MNKLAAVFLLVVLTGCTPLLHEAVRQDSSGGRLDLTSWNFAEGGPVIPQGWQWDTGVLWSPTTGRPSNLPPTQALGPIDRGGSFAVTLGRGESGLVAATAWLNVAVDPLRDYALQIGAFPGAYRVWVNGVRVRQSGILSLDPALYRAGGPGTMITVQPRNGVLALVVEMVTNDPLARHSEMNRLWIVGPSDPMMSAERSERNWRSLQATILAIGVLVFFWISRIRRERGALLVFVVFLIVCLLKLMVNVEQPEPLLAATLPGLPISLYLFLNHGLNLLPFPLFVWFLNRQFPEDVSNVSVVVVSLVTLVAEAWELFPFVALGMGFGALYESALQLSWALMLNIYVVAVVLVTFERFYHLYHRRRPLSAALFYGGMVLGLIILVPIPLSFFMPVKYTYFLGWGLFFYLMVLCFDLVWLQIKNTERQVAQLTLELRSRDVFQKLVAPTWAPWLGKSSLEQLAHGDRRSAEVVVVSIVCCEDADDWLPLVGPSAASRSVALVDWREGRGVWVAESWSETALAFALEVHRKFVSAGLSGYRVLLTRASVEFRLLDAAPLLFPAVQDLPLGRLDELSSLAQRYGASIVLDANLQDGLVIGGWRRHRHLTPASREIELYEGEEETLAALKDQTLNEFEQGLTFAHSGQYAEAVACLFSVVRHNPFDQAAKTLLNEWQNASEGSPRPH